MRTAEHELPFGAPKPRRVSVASAAKLLDEESEVDADPCAGWEVGNCEVIRRLAPGEPNMMLALRSDAGSGASLVVLHRTAGAMQGLFNRAHHLSRLHHPNLSRVFECEVSEDDVFWVTEFAPGATLLEMERACRKTGMALPLGVALAAVHDAALAVDSLRGAAVPRVFSTGDVVVTFTGATKLGCFTPSPDEPVPMREMRGAGAVLRPEIFSLGSILYECLCGEALRSAPTRRTWVAPSQLNIAVSAELDRVVMRAVHLPGEESFRTAAELAEGLKSAAGSFMWREGQRAQFVSALFPTRARRVQVLLAGCFDQRATSAPHPLPPPLPLATLRRGLARRATTLEVPVRARSRPAPEPAPPPLPRTVPRPLPLRAPPTRRVRRDRSRTPACRLRFIVALAMAVGAAAYAQGWIAPSDLDPVLRWVRAFLSSLGPCQ